MKRLAIVLLAGCCACASEPAAPSGSISSEAAQQLILERDEARDALAASERRSAAQIEEMRRENSDLRAQLGMAEETADQAAERAAAYEAGLGKAVAKLNEVSQEATDAKRVAAATRAAAAYQASARAAEETAADLSYFTEPHLSIVENSIMASGRFYNSGYAEAIGTLYLDLVRNGEVVYTAEQRIRTNQRSWGSWQQEFHFTPSGAQVTVVPRFEPE